MRHRHAVKRMGHPLLIWGALCVAPQVCSADQNSSWWGVGNQLSKIVLTFSRDAGVSHGTKLAEAAVARPSTTGPTEQLYRAPGRKPGEGGGKAAPKEKTQEAAQGKRIRDGFAPRQAFTAIGVKYGSGRSHKGYKKPAKAAAGKTQGMQNAHALWSRLISSSGNTAPPQVEYVSSAYTLKLDPKSYAILPTQTGGNILVDCRKKLPPLVKSLILEKYPDLVVVSESPDNPKKFFKSLLEAGQFFSTEEDFTVSFGTDPKVTVRADFKVEKDADSILNQEVVLLNVADDRGCLPGEVCELLKDNGFQLIEGSPVETEKRPANLHLLHEITSRDPKKILDGVLNAMSLSHVKKDVAVFLGEDVGLRLEVAVDRSFKYNGQPFVALSFKDDPNKETLIRLLEFEGHRVIALQEGDDLRAVTNKLFVSMKRKPAFGEHELWSLQEKGYGVNMSGVMIRDKKNGKKIFLTDREISPQVEEMVSLNGYRVQVSK